MFIAENRERFLLVILCDGTFLPRCMECRRALAMRILSVGPSVCQTRDLWQNKRMMCPGFYTVRQIT